MLSLYIEVNKNRVLLSKPEYLTSGCVNTASCLFSFDDSWSDYEKIAVFETEKNSYAQEICENKCVIPAAALESSDIIKLGVIGVKGDKTITTGVIGISVVNGTSKDFSEDSEYSPTLIEELLRTVGETKDVAQSVRADADAGKFNGADGVSITHEWNGTVLTIKSANGTSSSDLKGDKGDAGEQGESGYPPRIGINGNWEVYDLSIQDWKDTGIYSGGLSPYIGENGHWYVGNVDSGVNAQGVQGEKGEKGEKGDIGASGKDGINGKDGLSATHSWSGTTLTITSSSGSSSADLKGEKGDKGDVGAQGIQGAKGEQGEKGEAGYTPVRGADYWTPDDIAEIKSYVDEAILGGAW